MNAIHFVFLLNLLFIILFIAFICYWIGSLIDLSKSEFKSTNDKLIWLILLLAIAPIGTVLYRLFANKQKDSQDDKLDESHKWSL